FNRLFEDAAEDRFDSVLVWSLDRFSREGMIPTIEYLEKLTQSGVSFHSFTEPMISTDNELIRDIVLAVMASLAKQESLRISQRPKAGMERARAKGVRIGRPPKAQLNL